MSEYGGVHEIARKLNTSEQTGLAGDNSDLEHRRDYFGSNTIPPKPAKTFLAVRRNIFWLEKRTDSPLSPVINYPIFSTFLDRFCENF